MRTASMSHYCLSFYFIRILDTDVNPIAHITYNHKHSF